MTAAEVPAVALNRFKLAVPEGKPHPSSSQYAQLQPGQRFSVQLDNWSEREADCSLFLDGVLMGHYRIGDERSVQIERPSGLPQAFTFGADGSAKQFDAHLPLDPKQVGLLKAVFVPAGGCENVSAIPPSLAPESSEAAEKEAHPFEIAARANASQQRFAFVPRLQSEQQPTTLFLRLV